jgi:hypothetical protein
VASHPLLATGVAGHHILRCGGGLATPKAKSKFKKKKKMIWPMGWPDHPQGPLFGLGGHPLGLVGGGCPWPLGVDRPPPRAKFFSNNGFGHWGGRSTPKGQIKIFLIWPLGGEGGGSTPKGHGGGFGHPQLAHGGGDAKFKCGGQPPPMAKMGWPATLLFLYLFLIFYYFVFYLFLKVNIIKYYFLMCHVVG